MRLQFSLWSEQKVNFRKEEEEKSFLFDSNFNFSFSSIFDLILKNDEWSCVEIE